jgi:histidyl-tRNA synthetase
MEEQGLFPELEGSVQVFVAPLDGDSLPYALHVASRFRAAGLATEVADGALKMKKLFRRAERIGASYVALVGSDEVAAGEVTVKRLSDREQWRVPVDEVVSSVLGG